MDTVITFDSSLNECYICLECINDNDQDIYILECCKNLVHLKCLHEWCSINYNKNCFICNQYNKLCDDLSKPISPRVLNNNNPNIIIVHQNEITTTNSFMTTKRRLCISYIMFLAIIIVFLIIFSQDIF